MKNRKLLIVLGSLGRGGAEKVVSLIANDLSLKGWKVTIALLLFNKVDYELNKEVKIVDLSQENVSRVKALPFWLLGIRKIVKEFGPDVILSFAARINIITQLACIGYKKNIVVSERNDPYMDGRSIFVDILTNVLYPKAKSVVFQTERAASYFSKNKRIKSCIIPNPISVKCYAEKAQPNKIVSVGRLEPQKNQQMLIKVFATIVNKYPNAKLYIYGEGTLKDELLALITKLDIQDKVTLAGNVLNVHEQIADAEIFVLPSNYEGLSNALLEAMMMGLPCISTNCAGSDEYIENEINGLLVPVGDANALKCAILKMLTINELREKCGKEAQKVEKRVSASITLQQWGNILS